MASFRGHLATAGVLGLAYGGLGMWRGGMGWLPALVGAGLTAVGGLLPDLDSQSSVPHRLLFRLASLSAGLLALHHALEKGRPLDQTVIVCALAVVGVRFVLGFTFRRLTVHRGMFHSVPALVIAGLALFLLYDHLRFGTRLYLAGGVMIGFLSHLVLDELFAVDFQGGRVNNKFGTALKFFSPSFVANTFCYFVLFSLAILAWRN